MAAARNIYEQQAYNKRKTAVIVVLCIVVLAVSGYAIDVLLLRPPNADLTLPVMTILTLGTAGGSAILSFTLGWETVSKSTGAVPVNPKDSLQKQHLRVVEAMKTAAARTRTRDPH